MRTQFSSFLSSTVARLHNQLQKRSSSQIPDESTVVRAFSLATPRVSSSLDGINDTKVLENNFSFGKCDSAGFLDWYDSHVLLAATVVVSSCLPVVRMAVGFWMNFVFSSEDFCWQFLWFVEMIKDFHRCRWLKLIFKIALKA